MRRLLDIINDYIFVPKCGGCHTRMIHLDIGMCDKCKKVYLDEQDEFCDFCGMSAHICTCIPHNMLINGCIDYRKLIFYRKAHSAAPIRSMLYEVKRSYNIALVRFFANEILNIDKATLPQDSVVTFSPRMRDSILQYGYDHGKLLAKEYAKLGGYKFCAVLKRKRKKGQTQQKLQNFSQRAANIRGSFYIVDESAVKDKHVVLIDDVVTSGSTMGECVSVLYGAGARTVTCRSIAHTYRENKRKND